MTELERKIDFLVDIVLMGNPSAKAEYKKIFAEAPPKKEDEIANKTSKFLRIIGVPCHIKGYRYLRTALHLTIFDVSHLDIIVKGLYAKTAEIEGTTPSHVERAIRHAIEVAWGRGDLDTLQSIFGNTVSGRKGRPTNSEFIALATQYIRDEM